MQNVRPSHEQLLSIGIQIACSIGLLVLAGFLWARPVNLMNSDLGRHLENGKLILSAWHVPEVNQYSYTNPEYPVINHHWGTGVIFELLERAGGLSTVVVSMFALELVTLFIVFAIAWRRSGFAFALTSAVLALPLITSRAEIRPEIFSSFFIALFLGILFFCSNERFKNGLFALPVLMLFWVNVHVYFFLGIAITLCFFLDELLAVHRHQARLPDGQGSPSVLRALGQAIVLMLFATLINPASIPGALVPFTLFGNFGYKLAENQTAWFLAARGLLPLLWPFVLFIAVTVLVWAWHIFRAMRTHARFPLASLLLTTAFLLMAYMALRNWSLFGLVAVVCVAEALHSFPRPSMSAIHLHLTGVTAALVSGIILYLLFPAYWFAIIGSAKLGVVPGSMGVVRFFQEQHLTGPIFNNYDVGSGLIYGLYPQERVFVDNRPEAYPSEFFTKTLVPMQEDPAVWKQEDAKWKFNAIIFYRNDLTPWGQGFLIREISDPEWAPVYVDADTILFLKRNDKNAAVIKAHELPKSMFQVRQG